MVFKGMHSAVFCQIHYPPRTSPWACLWCIKRGSWDLKPFYARRYLEGLTQDGGGRRGRESEFTFFSSMVGLLYLLYTFGFYKVSVEERNLLKKKTQHNFEKFRSFSFIFYRWENKSLIKLGCFWVFAMFIFCILLFIGKHIDLSRTQFLTLRVLQPDGEC